SWIPETESL
ncbi:phage recombination protein Bet, partial [Escherichia coli PA38]